MFHKILVALDFSDASRSIFQEAIAIAKATNASLMLLHVLSPLDPDYPNPGFIGAEGIYSSGLSEDAVKGFLNQWKRFERKGIEQLQAFEEEAINAGIETEFTQSLGDPGSIICDLARSWQADLILVGRRGHRGLGELFLGSVSNYVLHHASCSVLTIQGQIHRNKIDSASEMATVH